jgi:hypothetical protein
MLSTNTDEQQRTSIRIDGRKYEIIVSHTGGGDYRGEWHCPQCERGDVSTTRLPDEAHAEQWARHCLAVHHSLVHGE